MLAGELVGEAESMMQRLCERLIVGGSEIETEYPTEGVRPKCVLQIEPTFDFPETFCVALQFPTDPDLDGTIEVQVTESRKANGPAEVVSQTQFSLDGCNRDKLREWVAQGIALAAKRYFEARANGSASCLCSCS